MTFPSPATLEIDSCPAYEFVLSLSVWSDTIRHDTYEVDTGWFEDIRRQAPQDLLANIETFAQQSDMLWAHLMSIAYECPPPRDVPIFIAYLQTLDPLEIRLRLLGYYVRFFRRATPPEVIAAAAAGDHAAQQQFLQTSYPTIASWHAALAHLLPLTPAETVSQLLVILERWYAEVFRAQEPRLLPSLEREVEATRLLAAWASMEQVIEQVTHGETYVPEPGIRRVLLIPSVVARPIVHYFDHHDVKIICYPVSDESMVAEDETPPPRLLRLLKALGDERRLRILKRLSSEPSTLQQLANHFGVSKTLMHHHLYILRKAGLIQIRSGPNQVYSLRHDAISAVGPLLHKYLEDPSS